MQATLNFVYRTQNKYMCNYMYSFLIFHVMCGGGGSDDDDGDNNEDDNNNKNNKNNNNNNNDNDNDNLSCIETTIYKDKTIPFNQPDITFMNKKTKNIFLIDIAVLNVHNLAQTITNKQNKYQELANEICAMWKLK